MKLNTSVEGRASGAGLYEGSIYSTTHPAGPLLISLFLKILFLITIYLEAKLYLAYQIIVSSATTLARSYG